jgi:probable F420-dependent oxidoreductase
MKFGVYIFATSYSINPVELAREAESRGYESIFVPEHTHIPASRLSPWGGGPVLPEEYKQVYDPFVVMAMCAAVTKKIRLGTGILLVVERDPIVTAKEIATLDRLSGGRVDIGVGGGWNREEMENHGTAYRTRWKLMRERIEAMKAIWTHDEASYAGKFVNFDKIWSWPKPLQQPHPPIIVGGDGARTLERVVRYGDAWMPNNRGDTAETLKEKIPRLQRMAADAGREPIPVTLFAAPPDAPKLEALRETGVERFIFTMPTVGRDEALKLLDSHTKVMRELGG